MGYERGFGWEDWAAESLAGLVILVAIIVAAVVITVIFVTLREVVSIFARRAFQNTTSARVLWIALAVLITLWFASGLLAGTNETVGAILIYAAAWATLLFVIVAEFIDVRDGDRDEQKADPEALDSYLDFTIPTSTSVNGHTPAGVV